MSSLLDLSDALNNSATLGATSSSVLAGDKSPSSPASARQFARNVLSGYIDEVRSFVRRLHELDPIALESIPKFEPVAVEECLDSADALMQREEDAGEQVYKDILDALVGEMDAAGVTLGLEILTKDARDAYLRHLLDFVKWISESKFKTGADQPLTEFERFVMEDFAAEEKLWVERADHITASRREFEEKLTAIRELRNAGKEERQRNEQLAGILDTLDDGTAARRKQMFRHVARRAAALRHLPKDNLSSRQRKQCRTIASSVLDWIDAHYDDGTIEELASQLSRVTESSLSASAASDFIARRNEVGRILDYMKMCLTHYKEVRESLGEDSVEGLWFIIQKVEFWLAENASPSLNTLEKLVESLRLASSRYGLPIPPTDAPVPSPTAHEGVNGGEVFKTGTVAPEASRQAIQLVDVACIIIEELQVLRVACVSGGASAFVARRVAPLQYEVNSLLEEGSEITDGAGPLLRRYKELLMLVPRETGVRVPASCWAHVLELDECEE